MSLNITLHYSTNYNGWGFDEDEHPELAKTSLESDLADMSHPLCDEDGEFEYDQFSTEELQQINTLVHKLSGESVVNVTIEYDNFST